MVLHAFIGLLLGIGFVVARAANALSYLSDEPETCINCHVMTDAYATWQRGSHARVAKCVDCHVPQDGLVAKYAFKAADGGKHSFAFTFDLQPQVLKLSDGAKPVVQANCVRCHQDQLAMIRVAAQSERPCWDCHDNVHGPLRSLSASPHVLRPQLPDAGLRFGNTDRKTLSEGTK